jgi:ferredoxin-NAD(P)+ reductase (naphthalene dioxygenase ferredoxin-specific)
MQMTLMPDGRVLNLNPGETLLSALRRHDEPISYSCQDGRCGLCRCGFAYPDLISSVNALSPQLEALSDVLACQTVPTSDCLLELSDRTEVVVLPPQVQRAKVLAIESVADHVMRLRVRLSKALVYLPGQSFELRFAPDLTRRYSAASLPDEPDMSFHIQIHPEGRASEHVAKFLKVGDTIRLQGPYGSAYLREDHSSPLLLVSSGTGLGAMLSQLRSLATRGATHAVHVYAGFGMAEEAYGREEFEAVTQAIKSLRRGAYVIVGGALRRGDRHGLITDIIEADLPHLADWRAYVFGSPHAVDSITRLLRRKGVAPKRLHAEPFLYSSF